MLRKNISNLLLVIVLSACGGTINPWVINPSAPSPYFIAPSQTPVVWMATPPSPGYMTTNTITPAARTITPTIELTLSSTASATAPLNASPKVEIVGCDTSLDISHQMGEVTNAYDTIRNTGDLDLTNVCAVLSASDEARRHPDKSQCIPLLPAHTEATLKLTVDTGFELDTSIQVLVTSNKGESLRVDRPSCSEIGFPNPNLQFGIVRPIP